MNILTMVISMAQDVWMPGRVLAQSSERLLQPRRLGRRDAHELLDVELAGHVQLVQEELRVERRVYPPPPPLLKHRHELDRPPVAAGAAPSGPLDEGAEGGSAPLRLHHRP